MGCKYSTFGCNFSAPSKDLLPEEIQILWSNIKYWFFFFFPEWNDVKRFSIPRWCQSPFPLQHSGVLPPAVTSSLPTLGHTYMYLCPPLPHDAAWHHPSRHLSEKLLALHPCPLGQFLWPSWLYHQPYLCLRHTASSWLSPSHHLCPWTWKLI